MTLIVENGSNVANADALASLQFVTDYHTARGTTTWTGETADMETAIRRASTVVSEGYTYQGERAHLRDQVFSWPRHSVYDREGQPIESDEIPIELKKAVAEIALRELITPGAMTPDFIRSSVAKSERIGSIAVEYQHGAQSALDLVPMMRLVDAYIGQFTISGGSRLSGVVQRV